MARVDRHGDPLPAGARARLGTVRFRNGAGIFTIAFTPDGKKLISAGGSPWAGQGVTSADSSIRVWEVETGKELRQLKGHAGGVSCLAVSPDGKLVVAGTPQDGVLRVWDLTAEAEPRQIQAVPNGTVVVCAFAPDGKLLAVPAGPEQPIRLWEVATGKEVRSFGKPQTLIESLAFSPNGKVLATKSGATVQLWDVQTGQSLRKCRPRTYYAKQKHLAIDRSNTMPFNATAQVAFSPDGKLLAAEAGDNTLHFWDAETGQEVGKLVHPGMVVSASFHPKGQLRARRGPPDPAAGLTEGLLVTGCNDNAIRVWDSATFKEVRHIEGHLGGYMAVAFAPDGNTIASAGGTHTIQLWDAATGKQLRAGEGHQGEVFAGGFLGGARSQVLTTIGRDNVVRFWDPISARELRRLDNLGDTFERIAVSGDAKLIATIGDDDEIIRLWDAATGKQVRELSGKVVSLTFSPAGLTGPTLLAGVDINGQVTVWDTATGAAANPFKDNIRAASNVSFTPDGAALVCEGLDNVVRLRDRASGKEVKVLEGPLDGEMALSFVFSPDGRTLAAIFPSNVIHIWDMTSGKVLHRIQPGGDGGGFANMFGSIAFAADGRTLAVSFSGQKEIALFEVHTGKERRRFTGHRGPVSFVAYSGAGMPGAPTVASGGWDTTVLLWDVMGLTAGERLAADVDDQRLDDLWTRLGDDDAVKAFLALRQLASSPKQAGAFLAKKLQPITPVAEERIAKWIADLDSDQFAVRQKAFDELEKLGQQADRQLRKALTADPSLEVRRRVEQLLEKMQEATTAPDQVRLIRAVELLEVVEARPLLEKLATGAPTAILSREAKSALDRLKKPPEPRGGS